MSEAITQAAAYDLIDRFLRNNLCDDDYAKYSEALEAISQPAPSPQAPAPVDERAEFEQWAEANVAQHHDKSDRHCMWWGWQARAALQSTTPQTKGQP